MNCLSIWTFEQHSKIIRASSNPFSVFSQYQMGGASPKNKNHQILIILLASINFHKTNPALCRIIYQVNILY